MLANIWNQGLVFPLTNALVFLYNSLGSNLGLAIIAITIIIKVVTLPLSLPMLKSAKKQRELAPELAAIKEKFKDDKKAQMEAQAKFLKEHGLNPSSGCIMQIVTLVIVFALYQVFLKVLGNNAGQTLNSVLYPFLQFAGGHVLNTRFLYLDLIKPDQFFILPIIAAATQFLLSKMMMPQVTKEEKLAKKTAGKSDDIMYNIQEQSLYIMPVMTVLIGWKLASGLTMYWFLSSLLQLIQQVVVDGHAKRWLVKIKKYAGKN
ncbi:MAG: YidC/Oxa1 family membrane protein insertase [candidate division WWE3 bacterium]|nr:YidC/Oxa1 family membrane protein insertase [candidate division WWE3 bacterium]